MMVDAILTINATTAGSTPQARLSATRPDERATRALVAVTPPAAPMRARRSPYREVNFLAQLIAVRDQLAQTRERRRVEPAHAIMAYRAATAASLRTAGQTYSAVQ